MLPVPDTVHPITNVTSKNEIVENKTKLENNYFMMILLGRRPIRIPNYKSIKSRIPKLRDSRSAQNYNSFTTKRYSVGNSAYVISAIFVLLQNSVAAMSTMASSSSSNKKFLNSRIIDSHLHVWAGDSESKMYPYADGQIPPESIRNLASFESLLKKYMVPNNIDGALIVQPINHKYDHSYVSTAIRTYPSKFKGMLLHDPTLNVHDAISRLEELVLQGFVGVRFNPYLWPKTINSVDGGSQWEPMSTSGSGLEVYKRCGELHMPVGIMCFQGLALHYKDIVQLLELSPQTIMILDHFAFTSIPKQKDNESKQISDEQQFQQLISLAKYPNVHVKISALFRLNDSSPYTNVYKDRFVPLLEAYGSNRLMYGSDFPFVTEQPPERYQMYELVADWISDSTDRHNIMSGTAERLFGPWGVPIVPKAELSPSVTTGLF
jgi:predicted TIM-barrel fold metal-dependent hydrolase